MTATAQVSIMGGSSVALLGYNVVVIKCVAAGNATVRLPTGFRPMCILPALDGATVALHTDSVTTGAGTESETTTTTTDPTQVDLSNATAGAAYFIIGQN